MKNQLLFLAFFLSISLTAQAQDLIDLLGDEKAKTTYTQSTFQSNRIVLGQSIESPNKGDMLFIVTHHFDRLNRGAYELWGLDHSTIRLGLEYGITNDLVAGLGRSNFQKTFDVFIKYKLLKQSSGEKDMPVSLSVFGSGALNSLRFHGTRPSNFSSRLSYTTQVLIARKFCPYLSSQLTPSYVHKNYLEDPVIESKDEFALGMGSRIKLSKSISLNAEYFALLTEKKFNNNSLSLGFDIETGGHIFQLFFTNSMPIFERGFITETRGKWADRDVYFGFNINRTFTLKKK